LTICRAKPRLQSKLGHEVLWAHEHHSGAVMYPSPLMTLAVLASRTERSMRLFAERVMPQWSIH
jgi:alkanesulfonate monooxygenase SsuD/methylene tetrahydromethanopterin reductase-like flavin-dependent oxidoreductase (luciferase family)